MPQKIGNLIADVDLNLRPANQQWNRFQQSIRRGAGSRDSLFGSISGDAREFENSLGKATNRVVAFGAAAAIFTSVARATSEFARSIVEVDKQLAAINVNLGQSAAGLKKFGSDLFNVARQTGQTFEVAANAAAELARQGLSAEETTKRLKDALILSRIAGLDSAAAVDTLTAAINSFNREALTSTEVVNKFAAVDTKFAVSSKDLAESVSRVGSTAQDAGIGLNELIALVTSLQQTTARGGAVIGNGLRTIFTRITAAPETVSALEGIGVAIRNTDGSLRDGISILKDYASARQRVGEAERAALDNTVAGMRQINILKALLGDISKEYSIYGNAVRTATNATDEAIRKNEQLNQTIASLLNSTGLSIKQLFSNIGSQSIGPLFKELLRELEGVRAFFSGDSGDELGKSLGKGILAGISNVLSGPAVIAIGTILVRTFKNVLGTILVEAKTLLGINGTLRARAAIQKTINNLLGQATQAELAQYQAANSVLAKKEQLLAIEARINQERLTGSAVGNSLLVPGRLGVGLRKDARLRGGYLGNIPTVADPIASAIAREQKASGLPRKDIYVDRDPRVANFANPLGILVANRRDEPLGGFQGVNRVISQGGNPKTAGMGATPNFALTSKETLALQQIATRPGGLEGFVKGLDLSSVNFDVQTAKVRKQILKAIESSLNIDVSKLAPVARRSYSRLVTEILSERTADISLLKAKQIENRNASVPSQYQLAASRAPLFGSQFTPSPEEVLRQPSGNPYVIPNAGILTSNKLPSQRNVPFGPAFPINPELRRRLEIEGDIARQERAEQRFASSQARRRKRAAEIVQRRQSIRNSALGASFVLPFLAGGIEPLAQNLGVKTGGGTLGGQVTGALGGAAQGAGIGGVLGGLPGLAIGGAIGGLIGAFSKLKKSTEEIASEFGDQAAARGRENDALSRAIQLQEQLNDALKEGADSATVRRLESQLREARGATGVGRGILDIKDPTARDKALSDKINRDERNAAINDVILAFRNSKVINAIDSPSKVLQEQNSQLVTNLKKSLTDEGFKSISNEQILGLQKLAAGSYNVSPIGGGVGDFGGTAGRLPVINQNAVDKAAEDFKAAVESLKPVLDKFGVSATSLTPQNINSTIINIVRALGEKLQDSVSDAETKRAKEAALGRLPTGSFLGTPNLDVYRQAALTGRSPLAGREQRAQARFDILEEFRKQGILTPEQTGEGSLYAQSRAGVQSKNLGQIGEAYFGRSFRNSRGDTNFGALEQAARFRAGSGSSDAAEAQLLLNALERRRRTAEDNKINTPSYGPNFDASQSGLAPGTKYEVTAGDALKAAQESVRKTLESANSTIIKSALSVDGTIRILSSDVLSSEFLQKMAAEMTASIGKQFQAQITDLNVRLSKAEGNPIPPTSIPAKSTFGNNLVKGSDGFIRKQ